jgi:hypothetical protein
MTPAGTSSIRAELWKLRRLKAGVEILAAVARRRAGIERAREAIVLCVDCEVRASFAWDGYEVYPGVDCVLEMRKSVAWVAIRLVS